MILAATKRFVSTFAPRYSALYAPGVGARVRWFCSFIIEIYKSPAHLSRGSRIALPDCEGVSFLPAKFSIAVALARTFFSRSHSLPPCTFTSASSTFPIVVPVGVDTAKKFIILSVFHFHVFRQSSSHPVVRSIRRKSAKYYCSALRFNFFLFNQRSPDPSKRRARQQPRDYEISRISIIFVYRGDGNSGARN